MADKRDRLIAITGGDHSGARRDQRDELLEHLGEQGDTRAEQMLREEQGRRPSDDQLPLW